MCIFAINDDKADTLSFAPTFQNVWIRHWDTATDVYFLCLDLAAKAKYCLSGEHDAENCWCGLDALTERAVNNVMQLSDRITLL